MIARAIHRGPVRSPQGDVTGLSGNVVDIVCPSYSGWLAAVRDCFLVIAYAAPPATAAPITSLRPVRLGGSGRGRSRRPAVVSDAAASRTFS